MLSLAHTDKTWQKNNQMYFYKPQFSTFKYPVLFQAHYKETGNDWKKPVRFCPKRHLTNFLLPLTWLSSFKAFNNLSCIRSCFREVTKNFSSVIKRFDKCFEPFFPNQSEVRHTIRSHVYIQVHSGWRSKECKNWEMPTGRMFSKSSLHAHLKSPSEP